MRRKQSRNKGRKEDRKKISFDLPANMSLIVKAFEIFERRWGRPKEKETCPCGAPLIFKKEPFHFYVFYIME
ncbi:hypothetical protein DV713_20300 (plasmid) [Parageobacillus thermoglucosidasius]|nr:hypothetical protein DV713_20300 [Parageobacillus thermoglucosidasius]